MSLDNISLEDFFEIGFKRDRGNGAYYIPGPWNNDKIILERVSIGIPFIVPKVSETSSVDIKKELYNNLEHYLEQAFAIEDIKDIEDGTSPFYLGFLRGFQSEAKAKLELPERRTFDFGPTKLLLIPTQFYKIKLY